MARLYLGLLSVYRCTMISALFLTIYLSCLHYRMAQFLSLWNNLDDTDGNGNGVQANACVGYGRRSGQLPTSLNSRLVMVRYFWIHFWNAVILIV